MNKFNIPVIRRSLNSSINFDFENYIDNYTTRNLDFDKFIGIRIKINKKKQSMKTFILLTTNRKIAEFIEATEFEIFDKNIKDDLIYSNRLSDKIKTMLDNYDIVYSDDIILVYPISDFMDELNNDEIDIHHYFISYVFVK
jgi:hypothetical protein